MDRSLVRLRLEVVFGKLDFILIELRWFLIDDDEKAVQEEGIFWLSEQTVPKYFDFCSIQYSVRSRFEGTFYENFNCPTYNERSATMLRKCIMLGVQVSDSEIAHTCLFLPFCKVRS